MRRAGILLLLFTATWDVFFQPFQGAAFTSPRTKQFQTRPEMELFIRRAPRGPFECVESTTGKSGFCTVQNIKGD